MATGMVLIIVSRNIDLSVGSLLGFLGYTMALVQTDGVLAFFGINVTVHGLAGQGRTSGSSPSPFGLVLGALVGTVTGLHRRLRRGARVHRHARRLPRLARRDLPHRRQAGPDARPAPRDVPAARRRREGLARRVEELARSPLLACAGIVLSIVLARRDRQRYDLGRPPDVGRGRPGRRRLRGRHRGRRTGRQPLRLADHRQGRRASPTRW